MSDVLKAIEVMGRKSPDKEHRKFLRRLAIQTDITLLDAAGNPYDLEKIKNGAIHFDLWYVTPQDAAEIKLKHKEESQRAKEEQRQRREQQRKDAEEWEKHRQEQAKARKQEIARLKAAGLWDHPQYKTLTAARADGWHQRKEDEVGGDEITIKGHTLVRNATLLRYVYKTTLSKVYGLTPSMIGELGKPDKLCVNRYYRSGPSASLYLLERVEAWIEDHKERVEKARSSHAARSNAMKAVHDQKRAEQRRREQRWVKSVPIKLTTPLPATLFDDVRKHYTIPNHVDLLKTKAIFAYVRHWQSNYETILKELRKRDFSSELYTILRQRIDRRVKKAVNDWCDQNSKESA